jgi:hypothetical protein
MVVGLAVREEYFAPIPATEDAPVRSELAAWPALFALPQTLGT